MLLVVDAGQRKFLLFAQMFQILTKIPSPSVQVMFYSFRMTVYLEYVLANNFFVDLLLLFVSLKVSKQKVKAIRLWLSAIVGSVGAVAVSFVSYGVWSFLAKAGLFFLITATAFWSKEIKKTIKSSALFLLFTFLLGGIIIGSFYLAKVDFFDAKTIAVLSNMPLGVIATGVLCFVGCIKAVLKQSKRQKALKNFGCKVSFTLFGKKTELQGIFDSGNSLVSQGLPVCFLCLCPQSRALKQQVAEAISQGCPPKNLKYVEFVTVDGKAKALAFEAEEFFINGLPRRCLLAFGNANGNGFDVLVNLYLSEEK